MSMEAGKILRHYLVDTLQNLMVSPPLWSDDPLPHGHAARSASAAFSAQNASGSEYRQSRTSAMRMSRKSCLAERSLWAAEPHEGAGGQAVDTCRLSPVWNTAVFAATFVAAHTGAKPRITRSAINMVLQQRAFLFDLPFFPLSGKKNRFFGGSSPEKFGQTP